jgi:hypothetical protein
MKRPKHSSKKTMRHAGDAQRKDVVDQAYKDRARGLANTDCRVPDESSERYCPRPAARKKR